MKKLLLILLIFFSVSAKSQVNHLFWQHNSEKNTVLQYISKYSPSRSNTNPFSSSITVPSTVNFLVVCIQGTKISYQRPPYNRGGGTVTFNGVDMQEVGSYSTTNRFEEMWYIKVPVSGTFTISIPNNNAIVLNVTTALFSANSTIALNNYGLFSGTSSTASGDITIPENSELLIIDSMTFSDNYPIFNGIILVSLSDISLYAGVSGALVVYASQYAIISSGSLINYTMSRTISDATHPWEQIIAVFKN